MEVLTNNHYEKILDLFEGTKKEIKIISPYISVSIALKLCELVEETNIKCRFITRFYLEDMFAKANSIDAIEMMMDAGITVYALRGLHTKLYLFDDKDGVLGSANFTAGGFKSNIELSLLLNQKDNILPELDSYFETLVEQIELSCEGIVTREVIDDARNKYKHLLSSKKDKGKTISSFIFGASMDRKSKFETTADFEKELNKSREDIDVVDEMFKRNSVKEQMILEHTVWLKFDGEGNNRMEAESKFEMTSVEVNNQKWYLSNYPFKVNSIKDNDEIYLAALTTDVRGKKLPVIVGRGYILGFSDENYVQNEWIKEMDWMNRYPWYCIITECTVIDTAIKNGIPLDAVWDELGSDTYISSFGKNESLSDIAKKHHQKAHIRLSGNAKEYIDKKLDELEVKYGVTKYVSDIAWKKTSADSANKISKEMIHIAYEIAKKVYEGALGFKEGRNELSRLTGMNFNSTGNYINNFKNMLSGERYARTMNLYATEYYLEQIGQDYGREAQKTAANAVEKHVEYYRTVHGYLKGTDLLANKYL